MTPSHKDPTPESTTAQWDVICMIESVRSSVGVVGVRWCEENSVM